MKQLGDTLRGNMLLVFSFLQSTYDINPTLGIFINNFMSTKSNKIFKNETSLRKSKIIRKLSFTTNYNFFGLKMAMDLDLTADLTNITFINKFKNKTL